MTRRPIISEEAVRWRLIIMMRSITEIDACRVAISAGDIIMTFYLAVKNS